MQQEPFYGAQVDFEEAKTLADLAAIFQDLDFVTETLKRLIDLLETKDKDWVLIQSLWSAALISYIRCFATGKRYGLDPDTIYSLNESAIEFHNYHKDLRDKHIAHSVNPFEQVRVDIQLSPTNSAERKVVGIITSSMKHIVVPKRSVEDFLRLVTWAKRVVGEKCKEYENKVLKIAKGMPLDDLYAKARSRMIAPSSKDVRKTRS